MKHLGSLALLALLALFASCGGSTGKAYKANVKYHLRQAGDACVRMRVSPSKPVGLSKEDSVSLAARPTDGTLKIGVVAADDWQGDVALTASLHVPCAGPAVDTDKKTEGLPPAGRIVELSFDLSEPELDGGADAGMDAGFDAGADAGFDAGVDAGVDAGEPDAGADAGLDGGDPDAGVDAGPDAGPTTCDGGLAHFPTPTTLTTWHDFATYPNGGVWLAGSGALYFRSGAQWVQAHATCFAGNHRGAWARTDGRVFVGTAGQAIKFADADGGACTPLTTPAGIGTIVGVAGFVDAGVTFLYSVTDTGTILRNTEPEAPALNRRWDFGDAGTKNFWSVSGTSEAALFAAGEKPNGDGIIHRYDPSTEAWTVMTTNINSPVNEISVLGPDLAYAGTQGADLFEWDGLVWSRVSNNDFGEAIYGIRAFAKNDVYGVGETAIARRWNGTAWTTLGSFDAGGGYLSRVKGENACDVWAGGSNGALVHSVP